VVVLVIGVDEQLNSRRGHWMIILAIGTSCCTPTTACGYGDFTSLGSLFEVEIKDFAHALIMKAREAMEEALSEFWEVAEHFGVPDEKILLQTPMSECMR